MSIYVGVDIETNMGWTQVGPDDLLQGRLRDVSMRFLKVLNNHDFNREPYPTVLIEGNYEKELFATLIKDEIREIKLDEDGMFDIHLVDKGGTYDYYLEKMAIGDAEWRIQSTKLTDNEIHVLKKAFIERYQTEDILYGYNINQIKRIKLSFS